LLEEINEETNVNRMWEIVKCISGNFKNKHNSEIMHNNQLATNFIETNFNEELREDFEFTHNTVDEKIFCKSISNEQIMATIKKKKDSSAGGENRLSYYYLKKIKTELLEKILQLTNDVWETGIIPEQCLLIKIVPILKPSRDRLNPKSYRPIA
jgi:hypothetical protein